MSRDILDKALDPFFTTKEVGKGTGLGLSIVYTTVQAHRGKIELRSEPNRGTRVTMHFPASAAGAQDPHAPGKSQTMGSTRALAILLVDDDELIQSSIQAILEVLGHRVSLAPRGEEALAMLQAGLRPDLVILDMNMPGLGGAGTLPRLRALDPTLPVLLATGRADQAAVNLVEAHAHVTLLAKPFAMKDLRAHLDSIGR
jgi:CheY-like chemotaxis protein